EFYCWLYYSGAWVF
nr:immunoglobulin light chain junction region [Macaca mulatta]